MSEPLSLSLDSLESTEVYPGLIKKVLDADQMTVTRYSFAPGGRFPHHVHEQEQVTYVLQGKLTFIIEEIPHELTEGSLVIIPSGRPHSAEAGEHGAEVLSFVSPARTEGRGISVLEDE